jgi:hypothetical protein
MCVAGYGSLPRANHSAPLSDSRLDGGLLVEAPLSSPYCSDNTLPLLETVSEDQEMCNKHRAPLASNQGTSSVHGLETLGGCPVSVLTPSFFFTSTLHCTFRSLRTRQICVSEVSSGFSHVLCYSVPLYNVFITVPNTTVYRIKCWFYLSLCKTKICSEWWGNVLKDLEQGGWVVLE